MNTDLMIMAMILAMGGFARHREIKPNTDIMSHRKRKLPW